MSETIEERIKRLREEKGLLLREVGSSLGLSVSAVYSIERGLRQHGPKTSQLIGLAKIFGVSTDYLLFGKQDELDYADVLFCREYNEQPPLTRKKIREIVRVIVREETE